MSLGRAILEAERLDLYDLETLASVIARFQERAVAAMSREDRARHQARERQRRARAERDQTPARSVTERDQGPPQSVTERDQSVTGSVTERDQSVTKRDALARAPSEDPSENSPSASADRSPQIDLSASDARTRESRSDVTATPSVTGHATERDKARADGGRPSASAAFDRRCEAVRRALSAAVTEVRKGPLPPALSLGTSHGREVSDIARWLATADGVDLEAMARRWASSRQKGGAWVPLSWLARDPTEWATEPPSASAVRLTPEQDQASIEDLMRAGGAM